MAKRKRSMTSGTKVSKIQEPDLVMPSMDQIAESLKGESLEMVDWSQEDKDKMAAYYQTKGAPSGTPTQEKLEQTKQPKTTPKKES
jgi:hypothetical protein